MGDKAGQASVITTLFLVIVITGSVMFLLNYSYGILVLQRSLDTQAQKYDMADFVKRKISSCYGSPIGYNETVGCDIPMQMGQSTVNGFEVIQMGYGHCEERVVFGSMPSEFEDKIVYIVPIHESDRIKCLGRLVVYV